MTSGQLFFVHFLMSVSGFRWWDHKPLLGIPVLVVGLWGSWFLLLVSFWSTADWSDQNCLFTTREVDQGCVTSMWTSLEWQTLEQRRRISRLVMMYKIQHQLLDIDRDLYLIPGDSRTRGQHRFFQERSNYDTLRNSFQRTAREWDAGSYTS
jgi:hypothetical protein